VALDVAAAAVTAARPTVKNAVDWALGVRQRLTPVYSYVFSKHVGLLALDVAAAVTAALLGVKQAVQLAMGVSWGCCYVDLAHLGCMGTGSATAALPEVKQAMD
jgi:hypothetical protein